MSGVDVGFGGWAPRQSVPSDYWNLILRGAIGYVSSRTWLAQPNGQYWTTPMWQFDIPCGISITDIKIAFWVDVEGNTDVGYTGLFLPSMTPNEYSFPMLVAASVAGVSALRYSDTTRQIGVKANNRIYFIDGTWKVPEPWPWFADELTPNLGETATEPTKDSALADQRQCLPIHLMDASNGLYGTVQDLFFISGFALAVNDLIDDGAGNTYRVVRNIHRTGFFDYLAFRRA